MSFFLFFLNGQTIRGVYNKFTNYRSSFNLGLLMRIPPNFARTYVLPPKVGNWRNTPRTCISLAVVSKNYPLNLQKKLPNIGGYLGSLTQINASSRGIAQFSNFGGQHVTSRKVWGVFIPKTL